MPRREAGAFRPGREVIKQNHLSRIPPNNASNATRRGRTKITCIQPTSREREQATLKIGGDTMWVTRPLRSCDVGKHASETPWRIRCPFQRKYREKNCQQAIKARLIIYRFYRSFNASDLNALAA